MEDGGSVLWAPGEPLGAVHSTKIWGNFVLKLNERVHSNRKSFKKIGPPLEVNGT